MRERENDNIRQAPLSMKSNMGLDPTALGSEPEPKLRQVLN